MTTPRVGPHRLWARGLLFVGLLGGLLGCESPDPVVQSALGGRVTVDASVDTTQDYSGFRVLVARGRGRSIDTLGHSVTARDGTFETPVTASERGVYPLTLWGRGGEERWATTELVVAPGDSAELEASLPSDARHLRVRSPENDAWTGYRNTMAQYERALPKRLAKGRTDISVLSRGTRQTSSILWSLQETYPDTYAAQVAAVESLSLLAGWNDSLLVQRIHSVGPSNPRFVEAAWIARRAMTRRKGQAATLGLLDSLAARAQTDAQRAGVAAVRVRALVDSAQTEAALSAARRLRSQYPGTPWARWASRAEYEAEHLQPGMHAPSIEMRTLAGDSLSLDSLRGRPVVLEFYRPGRSAGGYAEQVVARNALYQATRRDSVAFVSVSVEPDTLVNEAFLNTRSLPGHRVIAQNGRSGSLAKAYNVGETPDRFLIGSDGRLHARYSAACFRALQNDLIQLLRTEASPRAAP